MKVAIIGSGPAAIMCANFSKIETHIFTMDNKLGKKILVTGNGRCNLSNTNIKQESYNTNLDNYFNRFNNSKTVEYFNNIGLLTYNDEEGRVYPISNTATSVVDVLLKKLEDKNVNTHFEYKVEKIINNNGKFCINGLKELEFDKVVICTGSTDELLSNLQICHKPFLPSLVALKTKENTKRLSGIKLSNIAVKTAQNGTIYEEIGEILFKDDGISGICVFNISSFLARKGKYTGEVFVNLLKTKTKNEVVFMLRERLNKFHSVNLLEFMQGMFHKEVNKFIIKASGLNDDDIVCENVLEKLAENITNLKFNIIGCYDNNQINAGGVSLDDLNENLESKKVKGLYFAGEVCDVDGMCGGYNLQWAWTSGKIVGDNL